MESSHRGRRSCRSRSAGLCIPGHGKVSAADRWVSGGSSWHADFWFSTGRSSVNGYAIVAFEPCGNIVGVGVSFAEETAVRQGPLSGSIGRRRLSLHRRADTKGIHYDIVFALATASKHIGGGVSRQVGSYWVAHRIR